MSGHCFIHLGITQDWQRTRLTLQVSLALTLQLVKPPETGFWKDFQRSHSCTCTRLSVGLSGASFRGKHERTQRALGSRALLDPPQTYSCALQVFQEEKLSPATRGPTSHSGCSVKLCSILLVTSAERERESPHHSPFGRGFSTVTHGSVKGLEGVQGKRKEESSCISGPVSKISGGMLCIDTTRNLRKAPNIVPAQDYKIFEIHLFLSYTFLNLQ